MLSKAAIIEGSRAFPKPETFIPIYGTAGFRADASVLASTVYRCGLLIAARALLTGRSCGVMITASHNPACDNGVKLVEPMGEMMPQAWEPIATELAQCGDDAQVAELVEKLLIIGRAEADAAGLQLKSSASGSSPPSVLIGYDTRPSAPALLAAARAGVVAMGLQHEDAGQVTTPQLHFMVHARNTRPDHPCPRASLPLYFDTLVGAFQQLVQGLPLPPDGSVLHVDCANGVGAPHLASLIDPLRSCGLTLHLHNTGEGRLNYGCGADYVQKERLVPCGFEVLEPGARCCSFDGDADRLVFFTPQATSQPADDGGQSAAVPTSSSALTAAGVDLLDGDKIATLAATYIRDLLDGLPEEVSKDIKVGVIQTAYANGASTAYIHQTLGLQVECTPTGVKFLHEAAHHYDVGVYWESNGHGTVLFSANLLDKLEGAQGSNTAARELFLLSRVINQTVGDAISGVLLVEAVLRRKAWSLRDWSGLYQEAPSRQTKLKVSDRTAITTADAERRCVAPEGLQAAIDKAILEFPPGSRSFARPSGTEDAMRVYAEAPSQAHADALAALVGRAVYDKAGGIGPRP